MKKQVREFRHPETNRVWKIWVADDTVYTEWGMIGGKLQQTADQKNPVNVGRSSFLDPNKVALRSADRMVLLKKREGYKEVLPETGKEVNQNDPSQVIDLRRLPDCLSFYKPIKATTPRMQKTIDEGRAVFTRKMDGVMMVFAISGTSKFPVIYSRRMHPWYENEPNVPWSERFPSLVHFFREVPVPPDSIFLCELVVLKEDGTENLQAAKALLSSNLETALMAQRKKVEPRLLVWDIAMANKEFLFHDTSPGERLELLQDIFPVGPESSSPVFSPEVFCFENEAEAMLHVRRNNWEGVVAIDPLVPYGKTGMNFKGKPSRPANCVALKPIIEEDFIARWDPVGGIGKMGTGKNKGCVGALALYAVDRGEETFVSNVGTGLTVAQRREFAYPTLFPLVVTVKHRGYTEAGSLREPAFLRVHPDKDMREFF